MTPFQEFRLWLRRSPLGERAAAAVVAALAVAVLAWLLVPGSSPSSTTGLASGGGLAAGATSGGTSSGVASSGGSSSGGAAGSVPLSSGSSGSSGSTSSGSTSSGASGLASGGSSSSSSSGVSSSGPSSSSSSGASGSSGTSTGCPPTPSGVKGVTATQIKVAVIIVDLVGAIGNQLFGIANPTLQQDAFQAAINAVNKSGGVACRQLVPVYVDGNPADQSGLQQTCLTISSMGVYAVFDAGAYAQYPLENCYAQHKLPYFGGYLLAESQRSQNYPYLFDLNTLDTVYQDTVFGLQARGFFSASNGFHKLGWAYHDCYPQIVSEVRGWLHKAGVTDSQIVGFDIGCPALQASPSTLSQAILTFKQDGVTNVMTTNMVGDFANFTSTAQQQNFHPKYGLPDDSLIAISQGNQHPNFSNIINAIAITASRDGEQDTPGSSPTAGTLRCDAALKANGLAPSYQQPAALGNACDQVWMLQAAADHAPDLRQTSLAAGLQAAKSIDFSYPEGPNDFTASGTTTGGQFWRVAQFMQKCSCWQVIDPTFHPTAQ